MSDTTYLKIQALNHEIDRLVADYPELADDDQLRADMVEGELDLRSVLSRVVFMKREADAQAEAVKIMRDQMAERIKRHERRSEAMRRLAQTLLDKVGTRHFTLPEATLSVRSTPAPVIITDETLIPEYLMRVKREPNKAAIKDALKDNAVVPGAVLGNGGETLSIRLT